MGKGYKQMFLRRGDRYVFTHEKILRITSNHGYAGAMRYHFIPTVIDKN